MIIRFLVGMGEGAAYPNSNRAVASWMAPNERAASGLVLGGVGVGYGLAPPVVSWIMVHYGWRSAFYVFGWLGWSCGCGIALRRIVQKITHVCLRGIGTYSRRWALS